MCVGKGGRRDNGKIEQNQIMLGFLLQTKELGFYTAKQLLWRYFPVQEPCSGPKLSITARGWAPGGQCIVCDPTV